jgi:TonB family protein
MKTLLSIALIIFLGTAAPFVQNASAATKKKTPETVPSTVDTKPPVTTNETWSPKTNRQPVPTETPGPSGTPVTGKTPTTTKTPAPKKSMTPAKPIALGDKLKTKVVSNPQPKLPDAARNAKVSGPVRVEVTVDEKGKVISAKAVSGNSLLHKSAEESARKARFTPTKLSGQPVKVTGVIQYNFVAQ